MLIYLFAVAIVWLMKKVYSEYMKDIYIDVSKTAVPLIYNSINALGITSEELFGVHRKLAQKFKKSYRMSYFGILGFNVIKACDAEIVLNSTKHMEKGPIYNFLHPFLQTGLLTSKGDKWHSRRKMLTPAFHFKILNEFFEVFCEESDDLVAGLKEEAGKVLNIIPISSQFSLNTICETAMGVKLRNLGNDGVVYRNSIYEFGVLFWKKVITPWMYLDMLYKLTGEKAKMEKVLKSLRRFTHAIVEERKEHFGKETALKDCNEKNENIYFRSKKRRYAMLDTLLKAQLHGLIDDEGIMEETDTFTFVGHDTTSAAMTFTLLLMSNHPESQERIFEEIQNLKRENEHWTIPEINKMEYLDRVLKESMRIYPPVPFISRLFSEDVVHNSVVHPKGTMFNIHFFELHRDPEVFPDPETFDPDRFLPENCAKRHNFAYIPFSAGMRNCIGQKFALLEVKVMLIKIIENFRILPVTRREDVTFIIDLILRSKNPIEMKFELRK